MILLAPRFLTESTRARGRIDRAGAVTATLGVGALVYGIIHSAQAGWGAAATVLPVLAGAVLLGVLVLTERRAAEPIMPLRLFASSSADPTCGTTGARARTPSDRSATSSSAL